MRAVVEVVEAGSFAKAAEALFASPQTVKNQIDALETELGVRLFARSSKGTAPTSEGVFVYDRAKRVLEDVEGVVSGVRSLSVGEGVALACPRGNDQPLRDRICADFIASHSDIGFRYVVFGDEQSAAECMLSGKANATFCAQPEDGRSPEGFVLHACPSIPPTRYCAVVAEGDPLEGFKQVAPTMLSKRSAILADKGSFLPKELEPYVSRRHPFDDSYEVVNHCLDGGVAIDCNYMPIVHQGLARVPLELPAETMCVMVEADPPDSVRAFVSHCICWSLPEGEHLETVLG